MYKIESYFKALQLLMILTLGFSLSACISRLSRPQMTGQVIDQSGQPISGVRVGEGISGSDGYFKLEEQRYYAFLLTEILAMEAPSVYVQEAVAHEGYQACNLNYYHPYGGGRSKGARWDIGQVVLLSTDQQRFAQDIQQKAYFVSRDEILKFQQENDFTPSICFIKS